MKRLIIISTAVAMCVALGCEKKTDQPEEPAAFEVEIDGPPCVLPTLADENLLADQTKLARQARMTITESSLAPTPLPSPTPATSPALPSAPSPATGPAATMPAPDTSF